MLDGYMKQRPAELSGGVFPNDFAIQGVLRGAVCKTTQSRKPQIYCAWLRCAE